MPKTVQWDRAVVAHERLGRSDDARAEFTPKPFEGVDADYTWQSWVNYATARRSAVDLAEGIGYWALNPTQMNHPTTSNPGQVRHASAHKTIAER
jgi:hypothetical protein